MKIRRLTLFLMFCMSVHSAMPMENQNLEVATHGLQYATFLTAQDMVGALAIAIPVCLLYKFKKQDCFFGTQRLGFGQRFLAEGSIIFGVKSIDSMQYGNKLISLAIVVASFLHTFNLVHQKILDSFNRGADYGMRSIDLVINNKLDIAQKKKEIDDAKCQICYEDQPDQEYINPCEQDGHIFCKQCLTKCLLLQLAKSGFKKKDSFLCELCRKEVPIDKNVEVIVSSQPKLSLDLWIDHIGKREELLYFVCLIGLGMVLYG